MADAAGWVLRAVIVGATATAILDAQSVARRRLFGTASLDYALVGRWVAWLARGRLRHDPITTTPPVRGERVLGWMFHYASGIAFAAALLALFGAGWIRSPSLGPALLVGIGSAAAPFLLMQPGMGFGIAANRVADPAAARRRTVITHAMFGVGLYAGGWLAGLLL